MGTLVVKHNALTNASYSLDLVEQRLILLAIVDARRSGHGITANDPLTIDASDYAQQFGTTRQASYLALKDACENLFNRYFKYVDNGKNVKSRWVSRIAYVDDSAQVELIFASDVVPLITELERHFTQYAIEQVAGLNSAYAVRLYELLIAWRSTGKVSEISINELKTRLGAEGSSYGRIEVLKRRVLEPAIKQINEHTDITVSYEQHKKGRTITGFSFSFKFKKPKDPKLGTAETIYPLPLTKKDKPTKEQEDAREKAAAAAHLKKLAELSGEPIEKLLKRM